MLHSFSHAPHAAPSPAVNLISEGFQHAGLYASSCSPNDFFLLCLRGVHHPCVIQAFAKHRGSTCGAGCEASYSMIVRLVCLPLCWFECYPAHSHAHPGFSTWAPHACPCPFSAGSLHKPMPTHIHLWSLLGLHKPMPILTGCPSYATAGRPPCVGSRA